MNTMFSIRKSNLADESSIIQLLKDCKLPTQDISTNTIDFKIATSNDRLVGCIGIESYGEDVLLRSFAVSNEFRNNGLGSELLQWVLKECNEARVKKIHLLTTTAEKYFINHGFIKSDRANAPNSILRTTEFSEICPASSSYLTFVISGIKKNLSMASQKINSLFPLLSTSAERLIGQFDEIPTERKKLLHELTRYIQTANDKPVYLNFICTHNSRRSHISQLWAQAAAYYFDVKNITCFSGGTEATAFNPRAVKAMQEVGFKISVIKEADNPLYKVAYAEDAEPVTAFSKKYDDSFNNNPGFAAIMTCSHADENCPLVIGASTRIAITYDDPKEFDDIPQEAAKYSERVQQIGREMLFAFSQVN